MTAEPQHLPPHDRDAERACLGCVLRDSSSFHDVEGLAADDFYVFAHQLAWRGLASLITAGKTADIVTLAHWAKAENHIGDLAYDYLVELWDAAPTIRGAGHYAEIVRRSGMLRRLIRSCSTILRDAYEPGADAAELVTSMEREVAGIADGRDAGKLVGIDQAVTRALDELDRRKSGLSDHGIDTGWPKLDRLTGGMHGGELIFWAARPGVGKTLSALNMIAHVCSNGRKAFFASLEQPNTELVYRVFARRSQVNGFKFRRGEFTPSEEARVMEAAGEVSKWSLVFDDAGSQTFSRIASNARRLKMRGQLDILFVDYLQLMTTEFKHLPRHEQIGKDTTRLKILAKDLDIPIVVLSQLNREAAARGPNAKPRLTDLKASGDIEQDADTVVLLHKPEDEDDERETDSIEFHLAKQRNGPTGTISMVHAKRFFEIREMTEASPNAAWAHKPHGPMYPSNAG